MPDALLRTKGELARLTDTLGKCKLPLSVSWSTGKARSIDQNALQWKWAGEVARQLGDRDNADVQAEWKLIFGVPILREKEDFRAAYDKHIKPMTYEAKVAIMRIGFPVSSIMTMNQMTRYLDAIERHCAENGWYITIPED